MNEKDTKLVRWVEFVATKFADDRAGWVYSRDLGDLDYIRYKSDYTGYNHWTKRWRRALDPKHLLGRDSISRSLGIGFKANRNLKESFLQAYSWFLVSVRKDKNRPDGQINGIITHWEETGEYLSAFQPRVGVRVLDFLKADPENPYARAILDEMHAATELSFPSEDAS